MSCEKRTYASTRSARLAHRNVSARLRVYYCEEHGGYHVTAAEKGNRYVGPHPDTAWAQRKREREDRKRR